jgi:hypothetical protein
MKHKKTSNRHFNKLTFLNIFFSFQILPFWTIGRREEKIRRIQYFLKKENNSKRLFLLFCFKIDNLQYNKRF